MYIVNFLSTAPLISGRNAIYQEKCFSLRFPTNKDIYDGVNSKIAEKLGYKWTFIPLTLKIQKLAFLSDDFKNIISYIENINSWEVICAQFCVFLGRCVCRTHLRLCAYLLPVLENLKINK